MDFDYVRHPAERPYTILYRVHPARGWQLWLGLQGAWGTSSFADAPDDEGPSRRTNSFVTYGATWCEPEAD